MKKLPSSVIDFEKYLNGSESAYERRASAWNDAVINRLYGIHDPRESAIHLPWGKTHTLVALRPGELSLWANVVELSLKLLKFKERVYRES